MDNSTPRRSSRAPPATPRKPRTPAPARPQQAAIPMSIPPDFFLLPAASRTPPPMPAPVARPVSVRPTTGNARDDEGPFVIRDFESFPNKSAIGRGDYGTVFRVSPSERPAFAVKRVETKRAARDEGRVWSRVQSTCGPSSHVIPLLASWNDDEFDYYSMPLCTVSLTSLLADDIGDGPTLGSPPRRPPPSGSASASAGTNYRAPQTPPRRARQAAVEATRDYEDDDDRAKKLRRVLGDIARALACLHSQGIVYRDMKPDHILWCNGQWVLADLGHALFLKDKRPARETEGEGKGDRDRRDDEWYSGGAGAYLDPTVFDQGYDTSSDVYALGKMIWSVLLGRPPSSSSSSFPTTTTSVWTDTELDTVIGPLLIAMQSAKRSERPTARQVVDAVDQISLRLKQSLLASPLKRTRYS